MDLEEYGKEFLTGKNAEAFKQLAASDAGARLAERFGGARIEEAARRGDKGELAALLKEILGTDEGRQFAAQVRKAMDDNGR